MNFNTIKVNIEDRKAIIMLNREKQLNVINGEMLLELQIAADHLEVDDRGKRNNNRRRRSKSVFLRRRHPGGNGYER